MPCFAGYLLVAPPALSVKLVVRKSARVNVPVLVHIHAAAVWQSVAKLALVSTSVFPCIYTLAMAAPSNVIAYIYIALGGGIHTAAVALSFCAHFALVTIAVGVGLYLRDAWLRWCCSNDWL
jgi:hypothetical protein